VKFACDSCQTKYTIPDEKVRGKVLKIRCKKCNAVITVKEPEPEPEIQAPPIEERTRVADLNLLNKLREENAEHSVPSMPTAIAPPPEAPPAVEWYAMVNAAQVGPLSQDDFAQKVKSGEVTDRTHVWRDGMGEWLRASEVGELADLFAPPPPPPPPPAPAVAPLPRARGSTGLMPKIGGGQPASVGGPVAQAPRPQATQQPLTDLFGEDVPAPKPNGRSNGANGSNGSNGNYGSQQDSLDPVVPAPTPNLADLVSNDLDPHDDSGVGSRPMEVSGSKIDPFAAVPDAPNLAQPVIGEQTRFFMKKAGVTNRNPWWKYTIFAVVIVGLPVSIIYGLGAAGVGGQVEIVDSSGEVKMVPLFSLGGLADKTGLGKSLLGYQDKPPEPVIKDKPKVDKPKHNPTPNPGDPKVESGLPDAGGLSAEEKARMEQLAGSIGDDGPKHVGPVGKDDKNTKALNHGKQLDDEAVGKVVSENATAFNKCVEDELRRNPNWHGGRVTMSIKIKPSGIVTDAGVDKPAVDASSVGDCLKAKAKRMIFPKFEGEDQPVEFPLILTNGG
jgi:predicted Zn finger-like uncharacterized protein